MFEVHVPHNNLKLRVEANTPAQAYEKAKEQIRHPQDWYDPPPTISGKRKLLIRARFESAGIIRVANATTGPPYTEEGSYEIHIHELG